LGSQTISSGAQPQQSPRAEQKAAVDQLIPWLLDEDKQLRGIPFSEVIFDTTGKKVLPFDPKNQDDQRVLAHIRSALDKVMAELNAPDSVIQKIPRINEVSSHFEDAMRAGLTATSKFKCEIPTTADGRSMRSGYPDMRLFDEKTHRIYYLDPKLYATGSRESSFRTFYFEPKIFDEQGAGRRCALHCRIRTRTSREGRQLEIHPVGPGRPFAVQSETQSRISRQQSRYVSPGGDRGDERQLN
jgi:hypothetical protein